MAAPHACPRPQLRSHSGHRHGPLRLRDPAHAAETGADWRTRNRDLPGQQMNDTAQASVDPLAEPPEGHERNLWLAAPIIAGATIMFFLAFVFAYFYLRSLNTPGMWRPSNVDPPQGY